MPQAPSPTAGMGPVLDVLGLTGRCSAQIAARRLALQPRLQVDGPGLSRHSHHFEQTVAAAVVLSYRYPHGRG